jgi:hypothetical protein
LTPAKGISEDSVELVSQFILDKLPSEPDGLRASLFYQIISRLLHSLSRFPCPPGQKPVHFDGHRRDVELAPTLLEDLSKLLREGYFDGGGAEGKMNKKNVQRGKSQRSKVTPIEHDEINDRLFNALGREAPKNSKSAEEVVESIIATQKNILKVRPPLCPFTVDPFVNIWLVLYCSHANS